MPFHSLFVGLSLPSSLPSSSYFTSCSSSFTSFYPFSLSLISLHLVYLGFFLFLIWFFGTLLYMCVWLAGSLWSMCVCVFVFFKTGFCKTIIIITVKREKVFHINIFVYNNNNNNYSKGKKRKEENMEIVSTKSEFFILNVVLEDGNKRL